MDQEDQQSGSVFRYKSPTFRDSETQLLLKLIDKYKYPLLIKSTLFSVTHTKDKAWAELTKEFNSLNTGYNYERTTDVLRTKWDNLKRLARRSSKNTIDPCDQLFHNEIVRTVITICEADVGPMLEPDGYEETGEVPQTRNPLHDRIIQILELAVKDTAQDSFDSDSLLNMQDEDFSLPPYSTSENKDGKSTTSTFDSKEELKGLDCSNADDSDGDTKNYRPLSAFSARDCRLLLHCVRQEKNVLFSNSPLVRKQKAWCKIARAFNRQSPTKRSPPELKKKFQNLKALASRVNNAKKCFITTKTKKYEELNNDSLKRKIKSEPKSDGMDDMDFDNDDDDDDDDGDSLDVGGSANNGSTHADDPLSNGVTPVNGLGLFNHSDNKEMDKLKLELLNYEMETAKLQRKRIEDAIESEKAERELRALETSLRIRAARLEVLAAESKIQPLHPALNYTQQETRAQQYLTYRTT